MRITKQKLRAAAVLGLLVGAAIFWRGQPSPLPDDQVSVARAALQQWQARQTEDAVHGRVSSAGPAPKLETHSKGSLALTLLGFLMCAVAIVTFIQSFV